MKESKKFLSIILAFAMVLALVPVFTDSAWGTPVQPWYEKGSGTKKDPYIISNYEQLTNMAALVNAGNDLSGKFIKLDDKFPTSGSELKTPIGSDTAIYFDGNFDGNGKTVNLNISQSGKDYIGLFGYTSTSAIVKNVTVTGIVIGHHFLGGVVGINLGTVSNCYSTGNVTGTELGSNIGGVVGSNVGTVNNCYSTGNVSGYEVVGGVVGVNAGTVSNCYSTGNVTGTHDEAGGVVGNNWRMVSNCYSTGNVTGTNEKVGGVAGVNSGTVSNCYSTGTVSGQDLVGGVAGNQGGTVSNCYSLSGSAILEGTKATNGAIKATNGAIKTSEAMKSADFVIALNKVANENGYRPWIYVAGSTPTFTPAVAKIDNTEFYTVQDAVNAAEAEDVIKLVSDVAITKSIEIKSTTPVSIDLNGHVINYTGDAPVNNGDKASVIYNEGNLTITDSNESGLTHYYTVSSSGVWEWDDSKTTGARPLSYYEENLSKLIQGAVVAVSGGALTGGKGSIQGSASNGGGIYNKNGGTISISGGAIVGNATTYVGGAIHNAGVVTITGATITGNKANAKGGAIHNSGKLTITGADFTGNNSNGTGGAISNTAEVTITGATFFGNKSDSQGGAIYNSCKLTISGTILTDNTAGEEGGGIYYYSNGILTLSGIVKIKNNTASGRAVEDNLYIAKGKTISVEGLSANSSIGITTAEIPTCDEAVQFTTGKAVTSAEAYFFSDDRSYVVESDDDGQLILTSSIQIKKSSNNLRYATTGTATYIITTAGFTKKADAGYSLTWIDAHEGIETAFEEDTIKVTAAATVKPGEYSYTITTKNSKDEYVTSAVAKITVFKGNLNFPNLEVANKVYDGTTKTAVTLGAISGFLEGETVTAEAISAGFADANAGTGKKVYVWLEYGGKDIGNYTTFAYITGSSKAVISPVELNVTGTVADDKIYDGNTDATLKIGTLTGALKGDAVEIYTSSASFEDKNVGINKNVTVSYTLTGAAASNYTVTDSAAKATITQREVQVVSDENYEAYTRVKTYDGTTPVALYTGKLDVEGKLDDDEIYAYEATAGFITKDAAEDKDVYVEYRLDFPQDPVVAGNYTVTTATVKGTVSPRAVTLSSVSLTTTYNGFALVNGTATVTEEGFVAGEGFTYSFGTGITDVGTTENSFTYVPKEGTLLSNYTVKTSFGALEVVKRPVTLTSETDTQVFDNTALSNASVSVSGDGFVGDEGATYNVTGSRTLTGSSDNVFTYSLKSNTKAGNYDITTVAGTLTVEKINKDNPIVITGASASKMYDGEPLTCDGYASNAASILKSGDVLVVTMSGATTNIGTALNKVSEVAVYRDGVDFTEGYLFAPFADGILTVTDPTYMITVSNTYNGTVTASKAYAYAGDKITLTVAPASGYKLSAINAKLYFGNNLTVTKVNDTTYTFTMPSGVVQVTAAFEETQITPYIPPTDPVEKEEEKTEEQKKAEEAAKKAEEEKKVQEEYKQAAEKFTDVPTNFWGKAAVGYVLKKGFFSGVSETEFAPNETINMAEAVVVLYKVAGKTELSTGVWYSKQEAWAKNVGVTDNNFEAGKTLTRELFAQMVYKTIALDSKYDTTVTAAMRDALKKATDYSEISAEYVDAVAWAVANKLLAGTSEVGLTIEPKGEISRAETAAILKTYFESFAK